MAIRYHMPGIIIVGLVIAAAVILAAFLLRRKRIRGRGVRVANAEYLKALPVYRRKKWESRIVRIVTLAGVLVSLVAALFLTARPYRRDTVKDDIDRRDIFFCLDLSASGYRAAEALVPEMKELVPELDGDRIGITLFNTTASLYVPMTDEYEFVLQRLDELEEYLEAEEEFQNSYAEKYEYAADIPENERDRYDELNRILAAFDEGTTAGYASKGTSVIGESLASCLFNFPELHDEARTRILILATDNKDECIGTPLATLEEAADMCAKDGVVVFGIYPDTADDENAEENRTAMQAAVESTGGTFYVEGNGTTAEQILADIRLQEIETTKTVTSTKDTDMPANFFLVLAAAFAAAAGLTAVVRIRRIRMREAGGSWRRKAGFWAFLAAMTACVVAVGMRPMIFDNTADISTNNLEVCLVVDTTISMWAEDYNGNEERMDGVKSDIDLITQSLPDSNFSLIRFDNGAQILTPFTQDISAVSDALDELSMPSYASATGTSLNTVYEDLESMLTSASEKSGMRTVVFFFSDGEITDGSTLMDFSDLEHLVDDGAVIGYGTSSGGRMNYPGRGYLQDTSKRTDARSRIDEENLQSLASELGLEYIHSTGTDSSRLNNALLRVRMMSSEVARSQGDFTGYADIYYYFSGALAVLLFIWLFFLISRGGLI